MRIAKDDWILFAVARVVGPCLVFLALSGGASGATELTQSQWAERFEATLPGFICREDWYFRQCFSVTAQQCQAATQAAAKTCLDEAKSGMPAVIRSREDSGSWGAKVASCTGALLEDRMKQQKNPTAQCALGPPPK